MGNMVAINILDKEYQVSCPPDEQEALIRSSRLLDQRMRDIRKTGGVVGLERIAVMAALNLSYDLLNTEGKAAETDKLERDLRRIDSKLENALAAIQQPTL